MNLTVTDMCQTVSKLAAYLRLCVCAVVQHGGSLVIMIERGCDHQTQGHIKRIIVGSLAASDDWLQTTAHLCRSTCRSADPVSTRIAVASVAISQM